MTTLAEAANARYCPSLDDSGNGTSTLNDLIGSAHGTLTNMDPPNDWVATTAAGGVRALDFKGAGAGNNDRVITSGAFSFGTSDFAVSFWVYVRDGSLLEDIFSNRVIGAVGTQPGFVIGKAALVASFGFAPYIDDGAGNYYQQVFNTFYTVNTWTRVTVNWSNSSGQFFVYRNNALVAPSTVVSGGTIAGKSIGSSGNAVISGRPGVTTGRSLDGQLDDLIVFNRQITASERARVGIKPGVNLSGGGGGLINTGGMFSLGHGLLNRGLIG